MRRVKRPPVPQVLDGPTSPGAKERAKAVTFFANPQNARKAFRTFRIYKDPAVKEALNKAFERKCAYCESFFGATQPLDVEHYRPKAGYVVGEDVHKPGYYWLAANWDNLLPSCIDCNRERKQPLPDGSIQLLGKENQFPIASEARRASVPDTEQEEGRLLLHPYFDRPERHLFFKEEGIVSWERPDAPPSKKGKESIRVYALLRGGLVEGRAARQRDIELDMVFATRAAERLNANPGDLGLNDDFQLHIAKLRRYLEPTAPYSEMARQLITPLLKRLLP